MLLLCVSCGGPTEQENQTASKRPVKESLIDANRHLRESEDDLIEDFIRRYEWKVERTSSGLRYLIYAEGAGDAIQVGDTVRLEYELRLLNGQVVYTSGERGILEFRQGKAQVIRSPEASMRQSSCCTGAIRLK